MSYGWDPVRQADIVFLCMGLGFLIGFFRDILRYLRVLFSDRPAMLFVEDVSFCLVWCLTNFLLSLLVCAGRVRFYMFAAQVFGFAVWYFLPGTLAKKLYLRCKHFWNEKMVATFKRRGNALKTAVFAKKRSFCRLKKKKVQKKKPEPPLKGNKIKKKTCNHQKN